VQAHLARIEQVNPHLNAIVRRLDDSALAAAAGADRELAAGRRRSPFHGVPFTIKENIDVAGTPTTSSLPALADAIAPVDSVTVGRMRAGGAIPLGRTNLPDLGLRVTTESSLHGVTHNPWHPRRTAGGSSGGEGSALASGMSPIGLGNDIGGSLRNPAHCCGITSIKPSTGLVPVATVIPPEDFPLAFQLMAVEGVMARSVADVRAGLLAIAGPDVRDPLALPVTLDDHAANRPLRVAVLPEPPGGATDPGIAGAIRRAADALSDAGAIVTEASPPDYELAIDLWLKLLGGDLAPMLPLIELVMGDAGKQFLAYTTEISPPLDIVAFAGLFPQRIHLEKSWARWFTEHDVLLSPTWAQPAFELGADVDNGVEGARRTLETIRPVVPANLLGLPSAVVPVAVVDGLPVGAHLTARRFGDLTALHAAELLEQTLGRITPIDPVL
jgi:amidase